MQVVDCQNDELRPLLRMSMSIACLYCSVKTSQHAACECLPSFSHLPQHNVRQQKNHWPRQTYGSPPDRASEIVLRQAPPTQLQGKPPLRQPPSRNRRLPRLRTPTPPIEFINRIQEVLRQRRRRGLVAPATPMLRSRSRRGVEIERGEERRSSGRVEERVARGHTGRGLPGRGRGMDGLEPFPDPGQALVREVVALDDGRGGQYEALRI